MSKQETMAVGGVFEEFTLNSNGVKIKKCCASCAHHQPHSSDGPQRLCKKHTMIGGWQGETEGGGQERPL